MLAIEDGMVNSPMLYSPTSPATVTPTEVVASPMSIVSSVDSQGQMRVSEMTRAAATEFPDLFEATSNAVRAMQIYERSGLSQDLGTFISFAIRAIRSLSRRIRGRVMKKMMNEQLAFMENEFRGNIISNSTAKAARDLLNTGINEINQLVSGPPRRLAAITE
jgi:hypothetical protein